MACQPNHELSGEDPRPSCVRSVKGFDLLCRNWQANGSVGLLHRDCRLDCPERQGPLLGFVKLNCQPRKHRLDQPGRLALELAQPPVVTTTAHGADLNGQPVPGAAPNALRVIQDSPPSRDLTRTMEMGVVCHQPARDRVLDAIGSRSAEDAGPCHVQTGGVGDIDAALKGDGERLFNGNTMPGLRRSRAPMRRIGAEALSMLADPRRNRESYGRCRRRHRHECV
jgi:hypothetical protein